MKIGWQKTVKDTRTPLQFALALCGFLLLAIILLAALSKLPAWMTFALALVLLSFAVAVGCTVLWLLLKNPQALVFDKEAHITVLREGLGDQESGEILPSPRGEIEVSARAVETAPVQEGENQ